VPRRIRAPGWLVVAALSACSGSPRPSPVALRPVGPTELRAPAELDVIPDRAERSRALFGEVARVLRHPRCVNCHPDGDAPHQRLAMEPHDPPVVRGPANNGVPGLECTTCHQDRNQPFTRVPGAPKWQLAPLEMAWFGKPVGYLCRALKDPKHNGNRTLAQIADHSAHDELVGWAWHPGADREPAPGTQAQFGALVRAWIDTGAECPEEAR
jgi:hypothetical protein